MKSDHSYNMLRVSREPTASAEFASAVREVLREADRRRTQLNERLFAMQRKQRNEEMDALLSTSSGGAESDQVRSIWRAKLLLDNHIRMMEPEIQTRVRNILMKEEKEQKKAELQFQPSQQRGHIARSHLAAVPLGDLVLEEDSGKSGLETVDYEVSQKKYKKGPWRVPSKSGGLFGQCKAKTAARNVRKVAGSYRPELQDSCVQVELTSPPPVDNLMENPLIPRQDAVLTSKSHPDFQAPSSVQHSMGRRFHQQGMTQNICWIDRNVKKEVFSLAPPKVGTSISRTGNASDVICAPERHEKSNTAFVRLLSEKERQEMRRVAQLSMETVPGVDIKPQMVVQALPSVNIASCIPNMPVTKRENVRVAFAKEMEAGISEGMVEEGKIGPTASCDDDDDDHDSADFSDHSVLSLPGFKQTEMVVHRGPPSSLVPRTALAADPQLRPSQEVAAELGIVDKAQKDALELVEQFLLAHILSEKSKETMRQDVGGEPEETEEIEEERADIKNPKDTGLLGGSGLQLFIDVGQPVDEGLLTELAREVVGEEIRGLLGQPLRQATKRAIPGLGLQPGGTSTQHSTRFPEQDKVSGYNSIPTPQLTPRMIPKPDEFLREVEQSNMHITTPQRTPEASLAETCIAPGKEPVDEPESSHHPAQERVPTPCRTPSPPPVSVPRILTPEPSQHTSTIPEDPNSHGILTPPSSPRKEPDLPQPCPAAAEQLKPLKSSTDSSSTTVTQGTTSVSESIDEAVSDGEVLVSCKSAGEINCMKLPRKVRKQLTRDPLVRTFLGLSLGEVETMNRSEDNTLQEADELDNDMELHSSVEITLSEGEARIPLHPRGVQRNTLSGYAVTARLGGSMKQAAAGFSTLAADFAHSSDPSEGEISEGQVVMAQVTHPTSHRTSDGKADLERRISKKETDKYISQEEQVQMVVEDKVASCDFTVGREIAISAPGDEIQSQRQFHPEPLRPNVTVIMVKSFKESSVGDESDSRIASGQGHLRRNVDLSGSELDVLQMAPVGLGPGACSTPDKSNNS